MYTQGKESSTLWLYMEPSIPEEKRMFANASMLLIFSLIFGWRWFEISRLLSATRPASLI